MKFWPATIGQVKFHSPRSFSQDVKPYYTTELNRTPYIGTSFKCIHIIHGGVQVLTGVKVCKLTNESSGRYLLSF